MPREAMVETVAGAAVLLAAGAFLAYALTAADADFDAGGYALSARFGQIGGLSPGAEVRVAGVRVGEVSTVDLDPTTYLARTRLEIDSSVRLPVDSTARITADALLGEAHVAIEPGAAEQNLVNGAEITNTQGAVDVFGLIGRAIRPSTPDASAGAPPAAAGPGV